MSEGTPKRRSPSIANAVEAVLWLSQNKAKAESLSRSQLLELMHQQGIDIGYIRLKQLEAQLGIAREVTPKPAKKRRSDRLIRILAKHLVNAYRKLDWDLPPDLVNILVHSPEEDKQG